MSIEQIYYYVYLPPHWSRSSENFPLNLDNNKTVRPLDWIDWHVWTWPKLTLRIINSWPYFSLVCTFKRYCNSAKRECIKNRTFLYIIGSTFFCFFAVCGNISGRNGPNIFTGLRNFDNCHKLFNYLYYALLLSWNFKVFSLYIFIFVYCFFLS